MTVTGPPTLRTRRLVLRPWQPADREPFAELNRDPQVVEFLGGPLTREQSDALADRIESDFAQRAFGLWAVEVVGITPFAGFVGLSVPRFDAPFMPAVEVGWRLARDCWGRGYATEAAIASLAYGFGEVGLDEIVAFTAEHNVRSRRVMERAGMTRDPAGDFDHPLVASDALRHHVLYRARRAEWSAPEAGASTIEVRPIRADERPWASGVIGEHFGSACVVTRGVLRDTDRLTALVAVLDAQPIAVLSYRIDADECEVVALVASRPGLGAGALLLEAVRALARSAGCRRLWLVTTNDNLAAQTFYRSHGLSQCAVHSGAVTRARALKPEIPLLSEGGTPIEDEVEFEVRIADVRSETPLPTDQSNEARGSA